MTASPVAATAVQIHPEARLYIDGRLRDSSTGKSRETAVMSETMASRAEA
jgi:hypothetical protein